MPRVRLSKSAERWFLSKIAELAEVNPAAAKKLVERLERQRELLSSFPQMTERGILEGTRKVSMPPFVLTIRSRDGIVEIAAIRDARQKDAYAPVEMLSADDDDEIHHAKHP
ncbi:type II toxin-antitoxin system RelE/ParE family toxin [Rhizobium ruizarguesonis]|jgi:plasmid stabilization system protein ParE|uniref:type II toxin-antitoxin system RelE/ParE family toxin n=1 Tax=Rhizobium ruizarguesonis TaxID=2081791 RepID=UPI0010314856|nr:type II toxin-antitoxin system RelE/ParE family toxin [Rhizobium ruizarguesonis]NEI07681.1 type II toxin-antitoxin system RelE/ParE family toxin [Rhizobium ruizarguesonis]NEI27200.1 type II toxin-antitoxin system RelE/ParE family toxin [Rhizobium ruizarguesonis]TAW02632.1 type II toxin-antitoxin system RelE/ParE family toxin [Rhizobium ruizarguesonis]TAY83596.1 type II toxin-antitoxin system RelE/ParE family toxin [Rhizobium ruizarguesonis]TAZ43949.1 type II toxin-antitoxin system RelE/ParE